MFDIGASEFLLIGMVAIVAIGPKDLPRALRTAGRWIGQARRMSGHLKSGMDALIREAELAESEAKRREHATAPAASVENASDAALDHSPGADQAAAKS